MNSSDSWEDVLRDLNALGSRMPFPSLSSSHADWAGTASNLSARHRAHAQRHAIISRALVLQKEESKLLNILDKRLQNSRLPIGRLPPELLIMIFQQLALALRGQSPPQGFRALELASVCHRWMTMVQGPVGACLWTEISVCCDTTPSSLMRASRHVSLYLPRSFPLPFTLEIDFSTPYLDEIPMELHVISSLVVAELARCRALALSNIPTTNLIFPISGPLPCLEELHLSFLDEDEEEPTYINYSSLLTASAGFPSLRRVTLRGIIFRSSAEPQKLFGNSSLASNCTELRLSRIDCSPSSLMELLRHFPNVKTLDLDCLYVPLALDVDDSPTLSHLQSVRCDRFSFASLRCFRAPSLDDMMLVSGYEYQDPDLVHSLALDPTDYPKLGSLELCSVHAEDFDVAEFMALVLENDGLVCTLSSTSVSLSDAADILQQLLIPIQNHDSTLSLSQLGTFSAAGKGLELLLHLDPSKGPHLQDDAHNRAFATRLEALAMMQKRCKQVFGGRFRIRVSQFLVQTVPCLADTVSRFPDLLGTIRDDVFANEEPHLTRSLLRDQWRAATPYGPN